MIKTKIRLLRSVNINLNWSLFKVGDEYFTVGQDAGAGRYDMGKISEKEATAMMEKDPAALAKLISLSQLSAKCPKFGELGKILDSSEPGDCVDVPMED